MTASCEYPGGQFCTSPEVVEKGIATHVAVPSKPSSLPVTGGDIGGAGIGLAAIIVGGVLIQRARRRHTVV